MAEVGTRTNPPRVLVLPFPAQGRISPIVAFGNFLASQGLHITVLTTIELAKSAKFSSGTSGTLINIETISDGSEDYRNRDEELFTRIKRCLSHSLVNFLDQQRETGCVAKAIVYDAQFPWVSDIARARGIIAASFFAESCSACSVYYHIKTGLLKIHGEDGDLVVSMPALPRLEAGELPLFPKEIDPEDTAINHLADQFTNLGQADWIFFNTFDKLESEIIEWMCSMWPVKAIGPTISLPKANEDKYEHMINVFEATNHEACIEWLDSKEENSVVYVSIGSVVILEKEQMEELALGLALSNCNFLWVVRSSQQNKLPTDFESDVSGRGLVVEWCSQPDVLAHPAVACFMSHCGWNSFLEALSCGVPIMAIGAVWGDQRTNAKFVEDVWKVGTRVHKYGEEFKRREIANCVGEMVHGDKGKELKGNACKWKELVSQAVGEGGSSARNVDDFVSHVFNSVTH